MTLRLATNRAKKSNFIRARVGAVIAKGGRVLSSGCNRIGYTKYIPNREFPESVHAEVQAILVLLKRRKFAELAGSTMFVSRVNSSNDTRLAAPCPDCQKLIRSVAIRKVIYTTDTGSEEWFP